jgi:eukaryotic-like serine/threonine-protein kinase
MKQQMQWVAFVQHDGSCQVTQVYEMRGLPEDHYDYEEPIFLPLNSIKVIVEKPDDQSWREALKCHLEAQYPELLNYELLKVPRDPWDEHKLLDDPVVILKANLDVKAGEIPEVGNVVDQIFRVEKRLGSGAAGTAFKVTLTRDWADHRTGDLFCLKWYRDDIFKREAAPTVIARRVREATIGGSLKHPNLVRVYDTSEFWVDGKPRYLLMDLVRGEALDELIERDNSPSDRARQFVLDIANGLKALHQGSILHRDVKAANVMVCAGGPAVLLDLGVVRPMSEATMTDSQAFLGTLRFAAPEWLYAEECTSASDVYSLGTIAYHLLTGQQIFSHIRLFSRLVEAVRNQTPTLDQDGWDAKRQNLANLTRRMLSKVPKERPTIDELIEILTNNRKFEV